MTGRKVEYMERKEKLAYESPEIEIIALDNETVILTSNGSDHDESGDITAPGFNQKWI